MVHGPGYVPVKSIRVPVKTGHGSRRVPVKLVTSPHIYRLNGAWVQACTISECFWIFPGYFSAFLARFDSFLRVFLAIS